MFACSCVVTGVKYNTATAFSIHCKRLQTPNKQGDDGWKSVMYAGDPCFEFAGGPVRELIFAWRIEIH